MIIGVGRLAVSSVVFGLFGAPSGFRGLPLDFLGDVAGGEPPVFRDVLREGKAGSSGSNSISDSSSGEDSL
jgi:hypothetical protein